MTLERERQHTESMWIILQELESLQDRCYKLFTELRVSMELKQNAAKARKQMEVHL